MTATWIDRKYHCNHLKILISLLAKQKKKFLVAYQPSIKNGSILITWNVKNHRLVLANEQHRLQNEISMVTKQYSVFGEIWRVLCIMSWTWMKQSPLSVIVNNWSIWMIICKNDHYRKEIFLFFSMITLGPILAVKQTLMELEWEILLHSAFFGLGTKWSSSFVMIDATRSERFTLPIIHT